MFTTKTSRKSKLVATFSYLSSHQSLIDLSFIMCSVLSYSLLAQLSTPFQTESFVKTEPEIDQIRIILSIEICAYVHIQMLLLLTYLSSKVVRLIRIKTTSKFSTPKNKPSNSSALLPHKSIKGRRKQQFGLFSKKDFFV